MRGSDHKGALPPNRRRLVELMQRVNFGRIENLVVRRREPVFDPAPRVVSEWKFGAAENGPRPEIGLPDFALKPQVLELFALFDTVPDGTAVVLVVKHGVPFQAFIEGLTSPPG
jgi:hypothetical protein